jgi:hypothetical protein
MNVTLITAKLNGEIGRDDFDIMKATLAKDVQEIQAAQRAMTAEAEMFLHLTVDTSHALWVAAPRSEKQTPVTNELELLYSKVFWSLQTTGRHTKLDAGPGVDLDHRPRAYQGAFGRPVTTIHKAP